jgi:hypothetical protein
VELAVDTAAKTKGSPDYPYILADATALVPFPQQTARFLTVSSLVGYHPQARGRFKPGVLAGLSFVTSTFESQYPYYYALESVSLLSSVIPTALPPPGTILQMTTTTHHSLGALVGFETTIELSRHLSVVPEVRAVAFSTGNVGGAFLIRPGVGARWKF